jgi:hypothetical protein
MKTLRPTHNTSNKKNANIRRHQPIAWLLRKMTKHTQFDNYTKQINNLKQIKKSTFGQIRFRPTSRTQPQDLPPH